MSAIWQTVCYVLRILSIKHPASMGYYTGWFTLILVCISLRTRTHKAEYFSWPHCGPMRSFIWSWEGWSTTSHPMLSSSASRLGDSHSTSYFSISCEPHALHQAYVADTRTRAFMIQLGGVSMASGNQKPQHIILLGLE